MTPAARDEWTERAKRFLKAELKRADVNYEELAGRLTAIGIQESKASITMKINRGTFTAGFFLSVLSLIGCKGVRIEDV